MKITISRSQWQKIGQITGWSQTEPFREFMDSLESDNPAKIKPSIRMIIDNNILVPEQEFDRKKLDQIIGKHEFNSHPDTIKELARKLYQGEEHKRPFDNQEILSGYSLIVNNKVVNY